MVEGGTGLSLIQLTLSLSRIAAGNILLMTLERTLFHGHLHLPGNLLLAQPGTILDRVSWV